MRKNLLQDGALLFCVVLLAGAAKLPWNGKPAESWTGDEAERVLTNSPWAQVAEATFPDPRDHDPIPAQALPGPAQAGMAGPRGVSDGRWDGGVGNNRNGAGLPTLQVLVRWKSAEPVRSAEERLRALGKARPSTTEPVDVREEYVIEVEGLVPAHRDRAPAELETTSSSDESQSSAAKTEQLLENFMGNSSLSVRSGKLVRPRNVQIDAPTGTVRLFFPRSLSITPDEKEAYFSTRYGSLTVKKRFRLAEMLYKGRLAL